MTGAVCDKINRSRVDVWYWRTDADPFDIRADARALTAIAAQAGLSPDELERAARMTAPGQLQTFVASRAGLRAILAGYVGRSPKELAFAIGHHGKPTIDGGPFDGGPFDGGPHFNVSHAGDWVALAVCPDRPIGIDIERPRPVSRALPGRFFSSAEASRMADLTAAAWEDAFFTIWTRKEAVLKALGTGLSHDPRSFTTLDSAASGTVIWHGIGGALADGGDWCVGGLEPPQAGYFTALAINATAMPMITYQRWQP